MTEALIVWSTSLTSFISDCCWHRSLLLFWVLLLRIRWRDYFLSDIKPHTLRYLIFLFWGQDNTVRFKLELIGHRVLLQDWCWLRSCWLLRLDWHVLIHWTCEVIWSLCEIISTDSELWVIILHRCWFCNDWWRDSIMFVFENLIFKVIESKSLRWMCPLLTSNLFSATWCDISEEIYFRVLRVNPIALLYWSFVCWSVGIALLWFSKRTYAHLHVDLFSCHCIWCCKEHHFFIFKVTLVFILYALPNAVTCSLELRLLWILVPCWPYPLLLQHLHHTCTILLTWYRKLGCDYEVVCLRPLFSWLVLILDWLMCSDLVNIKFERVKILLRLIECLLVLQHRLMLLPSLL